MGKGRYETEHEHAILPTTQSRRQHMPSQWKINPYSDAAWGPRFLKSLLSCRSSVTSVSCRVGVLWWRVGCLDWLKRSSCAAEIGENIRVGVRMKAKMASRVKIGWVGAYLASKTQAAASLNNQERPLRLQYLSKFKASNYSCGLN
jgi:hypothetical protein